MIAEHRVQAVSLAAQVVEDVTFAALEAPRFRAALGTARRPIYKRDGYFVFTDLPAGEHTLTLSAPRFQPRTLAVTLPLAAPVLARPGENEILVLVHSVEADEQRVLFDPVVLRRGVPAGAEVLAAGAATRLAAALPPGPAIAARLESAAGISAGSVLRIVRQRSLKLRPDPYSNASAGLTRLAGRVTATQPVDLPLAGVRVRVSAVDGASVAEADVAGARVASVEISGDRHLLGFAADLATTTNAAGDFLLYFTATGAKAPSGPPGGGPPGGGPPGGGPPGPEPPAFLSAVTVDVDMDGYAPRSESTGLTAGARTVLDLSLAPL